MKGKTLSLSLFLALLLALGCGSALAKDKTEADLTLKEAALVLERIMTQGDNSIPTDLLRRAKAVAIFPGMFKAGFIVGGTYGTGIVCVRNPEGGFSAPAFYDMGGASVGFQIGGESVDLVLVVMKQRGLDGLMKNQVKFGADVAVAAGPVGRRGEAAVSGASPHADIYSYSLAKGLFAGVSLEGTGMGFDAETNQNYYGGKPSASSVLLEGQVAPTTPAARNVMQTLDRLAK